MSKRKLQFIRYTPINCSVRSKPQMLVFKRRVSVCLSFFFYFCLVKHSLESTSWPLLYSSSQAILKLSQSVTAHFMTLMYLIICNAEHVSVLVLQTTWNDLFCTEVHPQAKIDFFKLVPGTLVAILGLKLEHKPLDRGWCRFPRQRDIYILSSNLRY